MKNFENSIMRGEFRGDFTRDTFHPEKTYSRVLMQQGRVQLDADWNEQVSIIVHHLRSLACDVAGPHWGPAEGNGFEIKLTENKDFSIGAGHYYVNGILCENGDGVTYKNQPNLPNPDDIPANPNERQALLVYLDVWERHISAVEDDAIREAALGGPDTASRAKIVWQVKLKTVPSGNIISNDNTHPFKENYTDFLAAIADDIKTGSGRLAAQAKDRSKTDTEPCLVEPKARYRGAENQLYRVEIHRPSNSDGKGATFKWSRENGAVIFPILERIAGGATLTLEHLGRDERFGLKPDDWVEVLDDDAILNTNKVNLFQIMMIDPENRQVTLKGIPVSTAGEDSAKHPYLRRWDQHNGDQDGIPIEIGIGNNVQWIDLEDGIQISFPQDEAKINAYRSGDYWLIPARQITGDIEWPEQDGKPSPMLPHGVRHHYAPLAIIASTRRPTTGAAGANTVIDLRRILTRIWV
ncbi:DUF6519 domain-containing protein [Methylomicrobium sp. Wu6]|uniref:DUF6519 domain-containing protein n=1 Tax=Methylomicrobium sp. Wu6 TaxID=3107928 RepID=UPI002DD651E3|nr:DUF6519 domain-containing protein [Methylomicrobium sp. Wu6]MEC4748947.1 DUF6519 domain-containing protein [Methylomicrobium sp. Wu6]